MPPEQQNPYGQQPTQNQGGQYGQYPVVPATPAANNNGHTGHNPYDFIIEQNSGKKGFKLPSLPGLGGSQFAARLAVIIGSAVVLIAIILVAVSLLSPGSSSAGLTEIAQRQTEIVRVANLAAKNVDSQETKNFVANVSVSIGSMQQQTVSYLAAHKTKLSPAQLALARDSKTDAALESAEASNTYDTTVASNLTSQLNAYASLLQSTYKKTSNAQTKQLLSDAFVSAANLLKQAEALDSASAAN